MTRTISLITATVGAALLFAVPAWGDNWGADQDAAESAACLPDLADRAIAAEQGRLSAHARRTRAVARCRRRRRQEVSALRGPRERSFDAREAGPDELVAAQVPDWFERAAATAIRDYRTPVVDSIASRSIRRAAGDPVTRRLRPRGRVADRSASASGSGSCWQLGLWLAGMRYTRIRPLAH